MESALQSKRVILFLIQFIILLICIAYIDYIYITNIVPDRRAKETFKQATCFIISKKLAMQGSIVRRYRSAFLISYTVEGVHYTRWVSGNGLDMSFGMNAGDEEDVLSQHDAGSTYPCWYNPKNPGVAILVARHNWLATYAIMAPTIIGIIIFYFLIRNLCYMFGVARPKIGVKKSKK